jgi:hypothetical protein
MFAAIKVIVGVHGPEKCSGLEVLRFTPEALHAEFGSDFSKIASSTETHVTPWGAEQDFVYFYCRLPEGSATRGHGRA